jgi:hypothetical protein
MASRFRRDAHDQLRLKRLAHLSPVSFVAHEHQ